LAQIIYRFQFETPSSTFEGLQVKCIAQFQIQMEVRFSEHIFLWSNDTNIAKEHENDPFLVPPTKRRTTKGNEKNGKRLKVLNNAEFSIHKKHKADEEPENGEEELRKRHRKNVKGDEQAKSPVFQFEQNMEMIPITIPKEYTPPSTGYSSSHSFDASMQHQSLMMPKKRFTTSYKGEMPPTSHEEVPVPLGLDSKDDFAEPTSKEPFTNQWTRYSQSHLKGWDFSRRSQMHFFTLRFSESRDEEGFLAHKANEFRLENLRAASLLSMVLFMIAAFVDLTFGIGTTDQGRPILIPAYLTTMISLLISFLYTK
jgi:hypothetical protein